MIIRAKEGEGWIEAIYGCMFSGKSEELIRQLVLAQYAQDSVIAFKPDIDDRYSKTEISSHNGHTFETVVIKPDETGLIWDRSANVKVVGIDEGQFFNTGLVAVCKRLALAGKRVIVAGLHLDYKNRPFGPMPDIIMAAEVNIKKLARCSQCGRLAIYTFRKSQTGKQVVVGTHDLYEARCRDCQSIE